MGAYLRYWLDMVRYGLRGSRAYYAWMTSLLLVILAGATAYYVQFRHGLIVTHMTDQVSWGAYIANFTFLVGVAAAGILVVVPTYVLHRQETKNIVLLGEIMAFAAIVMCLMFVIVDLGRPDRFIHMLPGFGKLNFPRSILSWDVLVLSGYLLLNAHIPGYILYKRYRNEEPKRWAYVPFVFLSIGWAISIHTVTAFLYSGLGGRPYWNSAILAPRFLVSAFAVGPAIMLIAFRAFDRYTELRVNQNAFDLLRKIVAFMLPLNLFLFGCEVFTEFYTGTEHSDAARYLFFGLHGHGMISPYIWCALLFNTAATAIFVIPRLYRSQPLLLTACILCVVGVWIEKGMGLVIPGFVPSPLGDLVEYRPSWIEFWLCAGIWAFGVFLFSAVARVAVAIQQDQLRARS